MSRTPRQVACLLCPLPPLLCTLDAWQMYISTSSEDVLSDQPGAPWDLQESDIEFFSVHEMQKVTRVDEIKFEVSWERSRRGSVTRHNQRLALERCAVVSPA